MEPYDELLAAVDLTDQANQKVYALSTGMRQRINLCRALVSDPQILFLDEPTVGLDVEAARSVREYVRSWMRQQPHRTVLLTTHYMFEADELCCSGVFRVSEHIARERGQIDRTTSYWRLLAAAR